MSDDSPVETSDTPPLTSLPPRQQLFVQEYLIDLNATQAAIRAGYAYSSAAVTGHQLITNPNVAAHIERAKAQRLSRVNVTQESVLHEMSLLSNSCLDWFYIDDNGNVQLTPLAPEGAMGAVSSIKKRIIKKMDKDDNVFITYEVFLTLWDKPGSLKLMGKHAGLFPDKVEVTGKDGGPIEIKTVKRTIVDPDGKVSE